MTRVWRIAVSALGAAVVIAACGDGDAAGPTYCSLLQRSDQITLAATGAEPVAATELRQRLAEGRTTFDQLVEAAPEEIRADVQAVRDGFAEYVAALDSVGYDLAALEADPAALARSAAFTSDDVERAKATLAIDADGRCGITLGR